MERKNIYGDLVKALNEMKNPVNSQENKFFNSKYVPLADVLDLARPILSKHGFAILQTPTVVYEVAPAKNGHNQEQGVVKVKTTLIHTSGEDLEFPEIIVKAKDTTPQSVGSAITYARRYALSTILGISGKEEDDDGQMASHPYNNPYQAPMQQYQQPPQQQLVTKEQANTLFGLASQLAFLKNTDVQKIVSSFQISRFEELPQTHYQSVFNQLSNWVKQAEQEKSQAHLAKQQTDNTQQQTQQPQSPSQQQLPFEQYQIENIEKGTTPSGAPYAKLQVVKKATNERLMVLVQQDKISAIEKLQKGQEVAMSIGDQGGFKYLVALGGVQNVA